jgi:hypothetical protein
MYKVRISSRTTGMFKVLYGMMSLLPFTGAFFVFFLLPQMRFMAVMLLVTGIVTGVIWQSAIRKAALVFIGRDGVNISTGSASFLVNFDDLIGLKRAMGVGNPFYELSFNDQDGNVRSAYFFGSYTEFGALPNAERVWEFIKTSAPVQTPKTK